MYMHVETDNISLHSPYADLQRFGDIKHPIFWLDEFPHLQSCNKDMCTTMNFINYCHLLDSTDVEKLSLIVGIIEEDERFYQK